MPAAKTTRAKKTAVADVPEPTAAAPVPKGRKKAAPKTEEPATAPVAAVDTANTEMPAPAPAPTAAKKAKKPVKVVAIVTPNGIEGSFTPEPRRPLIAHLTVRSNELLFPEGAPVADVEPEPYNPAGANVFADEQEQIQSNAVTFGAAVSQGAEAPKKNIYATAATGSEETRPLQCFAKADLMVQFADDSKAKRLPERTDVACFWCAHGFDWRPCVIPEREVAGVYTVYGNFCCPECAFAYLLQETMDPHVRWERIALLHRIYDREGKGRMFPAAGREVLKLFGGPLTIESFRATMRSGKVRIDVHMPPMVSILGSIDTKPIDFFDSSLKNTLVGSLTQEKTQKAEEGLRLKRTKPLKDKESTLDSVMNIQIRSGARAAGGRV
jgi:hypothetical protein